MARVRWGIKILGILGFQDVRIVGDGERGGKKLGFRDFRKSRLRDTGHGREYMGTKWTT